MTVLPPDRIRSGGYFPKFPMFSPRHCWLLPLLSIFGSVVLSARAAPSLSLDLQPPEHASAGAGVTGPFYYPILRPEATLTAHSLESVLSYKTETGFPRWSTPNRWFPLDLYQGTVTREAFEQALRSLYDPFHALTPYLDCNDSRVIVYPSATDHRVPQFTLQFATPSFARPTSRWFRTPAEFRALVRPADKPLAGLRVAIDPGHIGGPWAQIEERSTRYRGSAPVQEGDLNLITARLLKEQLVAAGADVFQLRDSTEPVTPYRPNDMLPFAREMLVAQSRHGTTLRALPPDKLNLLFSNRLLELSEFLFYRCSEIIERGNRIRNNFVPDLTVTLYIDATPGSGRGHLTSANANIFFVHGSYTKKEMSDPEMQRRCVYKLVEGSADIESEVAAKIAAVFTRRTGLGPVKYGNSSTTRQVIPDNPYVVARNLAANREYDGPVVCTEPYFMNNRVVYQRLLAGDYLGQRLFDGKPYGSIFREYAGCVAEGLIEAYGPPTELAGSNLVPVAGTVHVKQ